MHSELRKSIVVWKVHRCRPIFLVVTATEGENENGVLVESYRREVC